MSDSIKVWQPSSKVFGTSNFVVPFKGEGPMTRARYQSLLETRLKELVEEDPREAKELLTDSPEHNPDLYGIGMGSNPEDYPSQILHCDQMQMLLNQIDWSAPGQTHSLDRSDLPSLMEIVETIPS